MNIYINYKTSVNTDRTNRLKFSISMIAISFNIFSKIIKLKIAATRQQPSIPTN